jgi:hypothetical protein
MTEQIISKSDLFCGDLVDKPLPATSILGADGEPIYKCPHCGNQAGAEQCGVGGAEPHCLMCNQCNLEFHC